MVLAKLVKLLLDEYLGLLYTVAEALADSPHNPLHRHLVDRVCFDRDSQPQYPLAEVLQHSGSEVVGFKVLLGAIFVVHLAEEREGCYSESVKLIKI